MSMNKMFSIIIPVYNGAGVVERALDSIYSQGLLQEELEVICVDDCSPTMETYEALNNYMYAGRHPENLLVIRHEVNKRQGGARNTALQYATGKWILYLDHDDMFVAGALLQLRDIIQSQDDCDIVMFDFCRGYFEESSKTKIRITDAHIYANSGLKSEEISGFDFMQKYPTPWSPWCYAYKRAFLLETQLRFVEGARFEDTDYTIHATLLANRIKFIPIDLYIYIYNVQSTTSIGKDVGKVEDLMKLSSRLGHIVSDYWSQDINVGRFVLKHFEYQYREQLKRSLWRISYADICRLIKENPPCEYCNDKTIQIVSHYPWLYALISQIARPFLLALLWMRTKMLRTNKS